MEKEKWKDDILNSLQGMQRAEPNPFLFTRIEAGLEAHTGLTKWQVRMAGALMVLLLAINLWAIAGSQKQDSIDTSLTTLQAY